MDLLERLRQNGTWRALLAQLRKSADSEASGRGVVFADGLWGSFAPLLAGLLVGELDRPLLYVTAHLEQADEIRDDLELFTDRTPDMFNAFEALIGEGAASEEIHAERINLCARLDQYRRSGEQLAGQIIVTPIQALMQSVPAPDALQAELLTLAVDQHYDPLELADWLVERGYTRLDQVEAPGDFALRGEILDIYPPGESDPYRLDFFGEQVESIRSFDVSTQRSDRDFQTVRIPALPGSDGQANKTRTSKNTGEIVNFLSYLPEDTIIVLAEPGEIQELGRIFWSRLTDPRGMMPVERVFQRANDFTQLHLCNLPTGETDKRFSFGVQSLTRFETKTAEALSELQELADRRDIILYCDNEAEKQRFIELYNSTLGQLPLRLELTVGLMHHGFDWPEGELACLGHHELFHRYQQRRRIRKTHAARPIESWLDLHVGDYVVHVVHGIARFIGMRTMSKTGGGKQEEYLTLEFAEKAKLHVPVSQIELVQKYIGAGGIKPQLSKLGGTRWNKTKQRSAYRPPAPPKKASPIPMTPIGNANSKVASSTPKLKTNSAR